VAAVTQEFDPNASFCCCCCLPGGLRLLSLGVGAGEHLLDPDLGGDDLVDPDLGGDDLVDTDLIDPGEVVGAGVLVDEDLVLGGDPVSSMHSSNLVVCLVL